MGGLAPGPSPLSRRTICRRGRHGGGPGSRQALRWLAMEAGRPPCGVRACSCFPQWGRVPESQPRPARCSRPSTRGLSPRSSRRKMWPPSQPVWSTWAGALLCSARPGHAGPSPVLGSQQACEDTAEAGGWDKQAWGRPAWVQSCPHRPLPCDK